MSFLNYQTDLIFVCWQKGENLCLGGNQTVAIDIFIYKTDFKLFLKQFRSSVSVFIKKVKNFDFVLISFCHWHSMFSWVFLFWKKSNWNLIFDYPLEYQSFIAFKLEGCHRHKKLISKSSEMFQTFFVVLTIQKYYFCQICYVSIPNKIFGN